MSVSPSGLTIALHTLADGKYRVHLSGPEVGERKAAFTLPYSPKTWSLVARDVEPTFDFDQASPETQEALRALGLPESVHETLGAALADALLADEEVKNGFDVALSLAEASRQPLPVELRFGEGSDALAALPWELLHYKGRFLVRDTSIALSRYPESAFPPTPALAELPLRVLLVLSEPVDASPIFSHQARRELLHGLRSLDEIGAVLVDHLRPPTFDTLVEAVTNGGYHMLAFYGHGVFDEERGGGCLLFEDEFGGRDLVPAGDLGAALRNTGVRLVLLGACQSAQTGTDDLWAGTAPALIRAGVPLAIGMQVSMPVDAALAFFRQFALSLAAGKPVGEAVADARKPLVRKKHKHAWFIPALYGRPAAAAASAAAEDGGAYRLFDLARPMPEGTEALRASMKEQRAAISALEAQIGQIGALTRPGEIARLRRARSGFARTRAELARRTPGGYAPVTSPLYGVPSNPVFVGRGADLREVSVELAGQQPVVIWGVGGIGKSALAIEVAHRQSWRFPGGVLWIDCRGGPAWDTLLERIGAFCGLEAIDQVPPGEKESTVRLALARIGEPALLIWDNAEDVWDNLALRAFLRNLPGECQALLTTREDPEMPGWPTVELEPLADETATALFTLLAAAARVKVGGQADLDAIPQIVGHVQGHPLALTVLVPLAKRHGIERTWRELRKRPPGKVEEAFDLSFERLSARQKRLFTRLSVFTIPFAWEAAAALLPGEGDAGQDLDQLVARALVLFDGARHSYHALLRQYAYGKLRAQEDVRLVHRLAAEYLQAKLTGEGGTPQEALEHVDQWEKAEAWEEIALSASALVGSLDRVGYWPEIHARLERARLAVQQHLDTAPELEAMLLSDLGTIVLNSAEWDRAIEFYEQSLAIDERVGDIHGMAQTTNNLGLVYAAKGEWDRAIEYYEQALETLDRMGDIHGMGGTYTNLGLVYARKGEWDRAIEVHERSLEIYERVGGIHGVAQTTNNLGLVYEQKGEWDRAIECYEQSLVIKERVGDIHGMAGTYNNLGTVYREKGEWERAIEFYEQSLAIKERVGDIHGMAWTMGNLGSVYSRKGEWNRAIEFHEQALETLERVGDIHGMALTYGNLGSFYQAQHDTEQAAAYVARAYLIFARLGAAEAQQAAAHLVNILGSVKAANTYLAQLAQSPDDPITPG